MYSDSQDSSDSVSEQTRLAELVAYRYNEQKEEQKLGKCFSAWKSVSQGLEQYKNTQIYRSQILKSKGFDGILEYAINTKTFRQKLIFFVSKHLKRTTFQILKAVKQVTKTRNAQILYQKMVLIDRKVKQTNNKLIRGFFDQMNVNKAVPDLGRRDFIKQSYMNQSRRSSASFLSKQTRNSRKYAPITQKITLPSTIIPPKFEKKQEKANNISETKSILDNRQPPKLPQSTQVNKLEKKVETETNIRRKALILKSKLIQLELLESKKNPEENQFWSTYVLESKKFIKEMVSG